MELQESSADSGQGGALLARARAQSTVEGVRGNALLTGVSGAVLILLLAAVGITILRIGQLVWLHLFLGLLLIGPLLVKIGATGYRFTSYYLGRPGYVRRGPPVTALRLLAVPVVVLTVLVMSTGIVLLAAGPSAREPWLLLHKASFIVWVAVTAIHVLAHLGESGRAVRDELLSPHGDQLRALPGRPGRLLTIVAGLALGALLALVLVPSFGAWTHFMATR